VRGVERDSPDSLNRVYDFICVYVAERRTGSLVQEIAAGCDLTTLAMSRQEIKRRNAPAVYGIHERSSLWPLGGECCVFAIPV
jgi:hypothetical protein